MSTPPGLRWLGDVTVSDLALAGIGGDMAPGQLPADFLADWTREYDVDMAQVHRCLELLAAGPNLLHVSNPLALMAYSPRRRKFRASIDTDTGLDLADLGFATAGVWLSVLAAGEGALPTRADDWAILRLHSTGISGQNQCAVDCYRRYARIATGLPVPPLPDVGCSDHDLSLGRAVWRCASYALR